VKWKIRHFLHFIWPNYWFKYLALLGDRNFRIKMRADRDTALKGLGIDLDDIHF
jgi:hypothetical protein